MKFKSLLNCFIFFLMSLVSSRSIAQPKRSTAFTGAVKRDTSTLDFRELKFDFNPTLKTVAVTPGGVNGNERIIDGPDARVFPSANVQAEVHISINKQNANNLVASANTFINTYNQGYYFTLDGGNTWNGADQLQNSPALLFGDPSTAFSASGIAHISTMDPNGSIIILLMHLLALQRTPM